MAGDDDELTQPSEVGLGARPEPDEIGRAVARARIANQLFQTAQRVKVGRYQLLELVGAGGMGVVWGAWDPELERRVAVKLVKAELPAARDRILAEGQALAKLSHPNVVPVHDVGVVADQVYLVMEWVRGMNLRTYCKTPRAIRELLAVYRAAGEGLAAAHRAGLVHRDFKPDNAMIGDDGRVRVLDFGLARAEVKPSEQGEDETSELTRGAGTPRYMAPEQAAGEALTPAVDQYALCVSLREALVARTGAGAVAPVPRWLDDILARGTAREAAHRYPSMDALLAELARDPATVWRRRIALAGVIAFAGGAFALGSVRGGEEIETCVGAPEEIARSWNAGARGTLVAHLERLGTYGASEARRLATLLDDYAAQWAVAHRDACLAGERNELTPQLYERNLGCLARARVALDTIVDVLDHVDAERVASAVAGAGGLPSPSLCLGETQTSTADPPPAAHAIEAGILDRDLARVRMLTLAETAEAGRETATAVGRAERLGYKPLIARAQLDRGIALFQTSEDDAAIARAFDSATTNALESRDFTVAVEAFARLIFMIAIADPKAIDAPTRERLGARAYFVSIAGTLPPAGAFARTLLYNNIGVMHLNAKHPAAAATWFAMAREAGTQVPASNPELNSVWRNLALVTTDQREREVIMARVVAELERELGPDHPNTLEARIDRAMLIPAPERSLAELLPPCSRFQTLHPHLKDKLSLCAFEVGLLADEQGDPETAQRFMRSVEFPSFQRDVARLYLALWDGRFDEVARDAQTFVTAREHEDALLSHLRASDALLVASVALDRRGRRAEALTALRRALALLAKVEHMMEIPLYARRRARVQTALVRLGPEPAEARALAQAALAWYRATGSYATTIAELEAIANDLRGSPTATPPR
jgi:eukaryotic-like serine/threonine-protein kinase